MNSPMRALDSKTERISPVEWPSLVALLDYAADSPWVLVMMNLGLGFNADLLNLAEPSDEPSESQYPPMRAYQPLAGSHGVH